VFDHISKHLKVSNLWSFVFDHIKLQEFGKVSFLFSVGGGVPTEKLGASVRPSSQNSLTVFMTKICDFPYSFHDLAIFDTGYL